MGKVLYMTLFDELFGLCTMGVVCPISNCISYLRRLLARHFESGREGVRSPYESRDHNIRFLH